MNWRATKKLDIPTVPSVRFRQQHVLAFDLTEPVKYYTLIMGGREGGAMGNIVFHEN